MDAIPPEPQPVREGGEGMLEELKLQHRRQRPQVGGPLALRHVDATRPMPAPLAGLAVDMLLRGARHRSTGWIRGLILPPRERGGTAVNSDLASQELRIGIMIVVQALTSERWVGDPADRGATHTVLPSEPGGWALL